MKNFKISQSITDRQDASLGIYFKDVSKQPMIDINEEIELAHRIKNGDQEALNKLIKANLRFVISVAKQYQNKGLPLVDLIQSGNLGICEAAKRWDESRGFKFISYAVWWIRQSIIHAISDQCRTVRVPMNQIVYLNKINKASEKFEQENSRKPYPEEIEDEINLNPNKINLALASANRTMSLDSPFKDDVCLLDVIPDEDVDDFSIKDSISKELKHVLSKLSNRSSDILKMSFGIGMSPMQNEEIAAKFGISAERVRQIIHETIEKIRINYSDDLKELL